jgi:hypothetical protein
MIFRLSIIILIISLFSSCHNKELEMMKQENEQLKKELRQRENEINHFIEVFNDVEDNLAEIRSREKLIVKNSAGIENADLTANVQDDLRAIDALMQQNKEKLGRLSQRLKATTGENSQLQRMVGNFELMVKDKDREIMELVGQLENLNYEVQDLYSSVSDLQLANREQQQTIDRQTAEMNRIRYIIATEKELRNNGIIEKTGGFLGLGKVAKLAGNPDMQHFKSADLREIRIFPVEGKKVKLLSPHPDDTYLLRKDEETGRYSSFEIIRPEAFWSNSRFMVLVVD